MAAKGLTVIVCLTLALPALAEVDVTQIGIQSAAEIADPGLRALRMKMVAGVPLAYRQMRALADAGDGLAAFKTAQMLEAEADTALVDDAIHYYALAARTGRDFAVRRLVALLQTHESALQPGLQRNAEDALRIQAQGGNALAAQALSDMYLKGKPFGKSTARGLAYMEMTAGQGDGKAAVRLGMMYLQGTQDVPADLDLARAMLRVAAKSSDLGSRTMAENLLRMIPAPPPRRPATLVTTATTAQVATDRPEPPPMITPRRRPVLAAAAIPDGALAASDVIRPRPRPAGTSARIDAAAEHDPRRNAPPRKPAQVQQAALQTGATQ